MFTVYIYVHDTLADWEPGYAAAELNSGRFFRKDAPGVTVRTVSDTKDPIRTMGGLTVLPELLVGDVAVNADSVLLLPGGNSWGDPRHGAIIKKAEELLSVGAAVCAICGATVALANAGLLDSRPHTSNGPGFLDMMAPGYKGQSFYVDEPSVSDGGLITAAGTGALQWAKQIIERLGVFAPDTLSAWYDYYSTGKVGSFYALMQSLPKA